MIARADPVASAVHRRIIVCSEVGTILLTVRAIVVPAQIEEAVDLSRCQVTP
jgi:hypothetical protein